MNKSAIYQQRRVELAKLICSKTGGGIAIITTNKGVMTDKAAKAAGVGGEVLCTVF